MRAALKVMPPILLYWPTISEMNVGSMAVEVEPSYQYSIIFCCCVTERGSLKKMMPYSEAQMKQRCVIVVLH